MKFNKILSGLALATSLGDAFDKHIYNRGLTVRTSSGNVHGFVDRSTADVRQFLGIPFAQPPVNELRWLPPKPLGKGAARKSIDAKKYPPACSQFEAAAPSIYTRDVRQFALAVNATTSEDCLKLSVWAPPEQKCKKEKPLPVFVWIYGGSFLTGSTDIEAQLPMEWVQRSQEHIVVGIQYRVNIFGFPNAPGLDSQNLGLLDQRMALEWVRDNIAAFGGDPSRITLWGQSAGGASVDHLGIAFPKEPIASAQIAQSGSTLLPLIVDDSSHSNFSSVATHFGCKDSKMQVACMRKVDFKKIEDYLRSYTDANTQPGLKFFPSVDEKVVFSNYSARYEAGLVADIPAIFGTNVDEGIAFAPYPSDPATQAPDQNIADFITNNWFLCPIAGTSRLRQKAGLKTYRYEYAGNFSDISPRPWMGAFHAAELPLVLGSPSKFPVKASKQEKRLSERMQDLWLAFGKDPSSAKGWLEASATKEALVFGRDGQVESRRSISSLDAPCPL